jgi:photosynthetic reaction center cytochrome c subunit
MKFSKAAIFTVATVAVAWLVSIAFATGTMPTLHAQQPSSSQVAAATPATPQMSDKVFKNVQVLKGITVDEFMGTMGVYTTSLSLCCGNCHVGAGTSNPKWEDDSNPRKRMARTMTQMVQNINKTNFGGRQVVTCWTCHRGQLSPSVTPPLDFAYGEAVVNPPDLLSRDPNASRTVDQIFARLIEAQGGQARLNQVTSYSGKGKSLLFGEVGDGNPAEIFAKTDGHFATYVHQQEGDVVRAYDGANAWWQLPLTVTPQYPLTATLLEGQKFDAAMAFPWRVRNFFTNWRVSFGQTIDGVDVDVIQGSTPAGMIGTIYLDKKTGLVRRYIRYANTMVGRIPTQVEFQNYRDVNGVKLPFTYSYAWVSERDDWTMTGYDINPAIDNAKFGRPDPKTAGDVAGRTAK